MSGWCTRAPGWRKTGSVRSPRQLFVGRSPVADCRFPLFLSFLCTVILWKTPLQDLGKYGHEFDPESFRCSPVSAAEIVSWKICLWEKSMTWKKQNTYIGISRQTGNGRIRVIASVPDSDHPDSDPPPWRPLVWLVHHNIRRKRIQIGQPRRHPGSLRFLPCHWHQRLHRVFIHPWTIHENIYIYICARSSPGPR